MFDYDAKYLELRTRGFSGWAGHGYERASARMSETLGHLIQEGVFPKPPAPVLELGCGNGMSSFLMAQKGYEVHGVDISPAAIAWAKERFASAGLEGEFHQGNVCEMPFFDDACFSIVIDGACLHCLIGAERGACLGEVKRILRCGGVFIVSSMCGLPKTDDAKARFDEQSGCLMENGRPYRTLKPLLAIERELSNAGFVVGGSKISVNPWWDHATVTCRASPADRAAALK